MSVNISVRMKREKVKEIDRLAELLGLDRASVLRRIIDDGMMHERLNKAIELYQQGDTMEFAANETGIPVWDLMDAIHDRGIRRPVDIHQVKQILVENLGKDSKITKKILDL